MIVTVTVSWPFSEDFDFASRWPPIRQVLLRHGFDSRATTSSSFVMFECLDGTAGVLQSEIPKIDSQFSVEWTPRH